MSNDEHHDPDREYTPAERKALADRAEWLRRAALSRIVDTDPDYVQRRCNRD